MSFEDDVKTKIREITRDLEEDRELQLDVAMELESHLWESYDSALESGMSEEESQEHAFMEFGDLVDVKTRIVGGNIKRMKSRAIAKVFLWYISLPISIIFALYLGWNEFSEIRAVNEIMRNGTRLIEKIDKDSPLLKLRQLESYSDGFDENLCNELIKEFPNNGYLDALWVARNCRKFIDYESFTIADVKGFNTLIDRLKIISQKSEYSAYHYEELAKIQHMGKPGFSKLILQIGQSASFMLPEVSMWRTLGRVIFKAGNVENTILFGGVCQKILKQSDTLIVLLIMGAVGGIYKDHDGLVTKVKDQSPETHHFFMKCYNVIKSWRNSNDKKDELKELLISKGGVLASMIVPALRDVSLTEESLEPSRRMEYSFFEKVYFVILNSFLFVVTLSILIFALIKRFFSKDKIFLITYNFREWGSHIAKTVMLPILIYQVYKLLPFSSANYGIRQSYWILGLEIITLTACLIYWSSYRILKKQSERLEVLDLEKSSQINLKNYTVLFISMVLLGIAMCVALNEKLLEFFYPLNVLLHMNDSQLNVVEIKVLEYVGVFTTGVIFMVCFWWLLWKRLSFKAISVYNLATTLCLHLAFVSLILGLYSSTYLGALEAHYFKKDNFVFSTNKPTMFTAIEENVVIELKEKILGSKN